MAGGSAAGSAAPSPASSPRALRRDPSILKGSFRRRAADRDRDPPAVTFNVENEHDSDDDGQITFSARPRPAAHYRAPAAPPPPEAPRSRPSSLLMAGEEPPDARLAARSRSVEDSSRAGASGSPVVDLKLRGLRKTAAILRKVSSAERLTRLKDKIMRGGGSRERSPARDEAPSDDESAPLVAGAGGAPPPLGVSVSLEAGSADPSPRSDLTSLESPRSPDPLHAPGAPGGERCDSLGSLCNMVEPYNLRLLAPGPERALWRQDALDPGPPWPWDEPDSPV